MRQLGADPVDRGRRSIDELDSDLLAKLERRDKQLYAILNSTCRYRNVLADEIKHLRAGSAPELARAQLALWDPLRREIKWLAQNL